MSLPKADDESPIRGPYKIEDWGKTWLNPNKDRVLARVPAIALPDIATSFPTSEPSRSSTRPTGTSCSFVGLPEAPVPMEPLRQ